MAQEELQLSPEEERLLRRFFHRQALPYAAAAAVLAVLVGLFAHGLRGTDDSAPQPESAPIAAADLADFETTRAAAEGFLVELRKAAQRDQDGLTALEQQMSELEKRIAGARGRLQKLDARVQEIGASAAAPPPPGGAATSPSPAAAPADQNGVLERLYKLEVRQDQLEDRSTTHTAERTEVMKEILNRLYELEARTTAVEQGRQPEIPAAPDSSGAS